MHFKSLKNDAITQGIRGVRNTSRQISDPTWPFDSQDHNIALFLNHFSLAQCFKKKLDISSANLFFADGFLFARQASLTGLQVSRASFDLTSVALSWTQECNRRGISILFVGGTEEEAFIFREWLLEACPENPRSVHCVDGYGRSDWKHLLQTISLEYSEVFIVFGTGSPRQETQAFEASGIARSLFQRSITTTCGGFITQTAKSLAAQDCDGNFYPSWVRRYGFRWLYRCFTQPYVMGRLIKVYPPMMARILIRSSLMKH